MVVEPTDGWVSVSSPVREKESDEVQLSNCINMWFSPDASQVTLWDLVKEGSLDQLIVVLDSLQDQVNFSILYIYGC